eukprot:m.17913 g.17913  ORF g.17913 m.17913 type:complete len:248 (+) comp27565_c0_seq3:34-777(+)
MFAAVLLLLLAIAGHDDARFVITDLGDGEVCEREGPCKCKAGSKMLDLNPLQNGTVPRFSHVFDGQWYYDYNPCANFSNDFCSNAAICQMSANSSDGTGFNCGTADTSFGNTVDDGKLYIDYTGGDAVGNTSRMSRVICICENEEEGVLEAFGDGGTLQYDFTLTSKYCCLVAVNGISPGSILLILFFSALFLYIVVGILVMKFGRGAEGKEVIPNISFWFGLPGLVKTGVLFVFCCRRNKVDYENL